MSRIFLLILLQLTRSIKSKVARESSQSAPKKARVEESVAAAEIPSVMPDVEVVETPPRRATSPPVQTAEESRVPVPDIPSPVVEPVVEDATQVFESVIQMTADWVQRLAKHKKYIKAASSFPSYYIGQALT